MKQIHCVLNSVVLRKLWPLGELPRDSDREKRVVGLIWGILQKLWRPDTEGCTELLRGDCFKNNSLFYKSNFADIMQTLAKCNSLF